MHKERSKNVPTPARKFFWNKGRYGVMWLNRLGPNGFTVVPDINNFVENVVDLETPVHLSSAHSSFNGVSNIYHKDFKVKVKQSKDCLSIKLCIHFMFVLL